MALRWDWKKDKVGTWKQKDKEGNEYCYNLYSGNALLIMIWENNDNNTYQVCDFFLDKNHLKNCFGLTKEYKENIYANYSISVELDSNYKYTPDIAFALCKAKFNDDIIITIKCIPWNR